MTEQQKKLYASILHGLRSQGWSRVEAESEALDRVIRPRPKPSIQITTEERNE